MARKLEQEVWALDKCCGCGNCVAVCAKGVLYWGAGEAPALEKRQKALGLSHTPLDTCSFCPQLCEQGCPRLDDGHQALAPRRTLSVRAKGIVQSGEPNDAIKHLLIASLSAGLIDGAILTDIDPWSLRPVVRVATSVGEVADTLGIPNLSAPPLSSLNEALFERGVKHLAVVGPPCVSQAVQKLRASTNERLKPYQAALRLNVATFCTAAYLPEPMSTILSERLGRPMTDVKRVEASPRRNSLTVHLWDGTQSAVPLTDLDGCTRKGCARCDDYLGECADIAIGTVGAKDGFCTLITRSQTGEVILNNALDFGLLEFSIEVNREDLERAKSDKKRRQRAQAFDRLTVMMLDAMSEPAKRAAVKQAFIRLYEVKKPGQHIQKEADCVACSQC